MSTPDQGKILLIEDRKKNCHELSVVLEFLGESLVVSEHATWRDAAESEFDSVDEIQLVLIGEYTNSTLATLLGQISSWQEGAPVIVLGSEEEIAQLPEELQTRITASIPLPLSFQPVLDALHKAQVYREHYRRLHSIGGVRDYNMFRSLVGNSPAVQHIRQVMGQVANTEVTVLITGESGTGKEVVARNLHMNSSRADKPFVPINCGAIPPDLLESELFGHEKGAFTGAISTRIGRFELAEGGTLFLDEIGDMPLPMQVKLLRVIQEQCYERVGGTKTLHTDVRILAATHKNLEEMIEQGSFRQDLYYRINVFPIEMPALRERPSDVPFLLNELISRMEQQKRGSVRFNSAAIRSLCRHPWPGNVRELANLVERMSILHPYDVVGVNQLPQQYRHLADAELEAAEDSPDDSNAFQLILPELNDGNGSAGKPLIERRQQPRGEDGNASNLLPLNGLDLKEYLANLERDLIEQALEDSGGVVARAADRLHIRRTTLVEKMRKYELQKKPDA